MSEELLEAVRAAAKPGVWSQGVKLARAGAVRLVARDAEQVELAVLAPPRPFPANVTLFPDGAEWSCDCDSAWDVCEHVAAATIQLAQGGFAAAAPTSAPSAPVADSSTVASPSGGLSGAPSLAYHWTWLGRRLVLTRTLRHESGVDEPLTGTLAQLLASRRPVFCREEDLLIDRLLSAMLRGSAIEDRLTTIFPALVGQRFLFWDGAPVTVREGLAIPQAELIDRGDQLVLRVTKGTEDLEVVCPRLGRVGATFQLLGETELLGARWEKLPWERSFPPATWGELAAEVVPEFERRFAFTLRTKRLPGLAVERPRITFEVTPSEGAWAVLPTLVYGDPPLARIDQDELVLLHPPAPRRDRTAERQLVQRLRAELNLVPGQRIRVTGSEARAMVTKIRSFAESTGDEAALRRFGQLPLRPTLAVEGEQFHLEFQLPDGAAGESATPEAVLDAWREGHGMVPLLSGGWASLPADWLSRYGDLVADLLEARDAQGRVGTVGLPALGRLCEALDQPPPPALDGLRPLIEGFEGLPEVGPPPDLHADLRPYQLAGYRWLAFLKKAHLGALLADDMGLGKTLQAMAVLERRSLIVCPLSLLSNWAAELKRFRPSLRVALYHGTQRSLQQDADVWLTTYGLLRSDLVQLSAVTWEVLVLDEAQAIKNPDSQAARAAYAIPARFRVGLSGTPLENRLEELWSLMHFANPGLLGGLRDFQRRYVAPIMDGDGETAARLRERVRPFLLRRLKRDVLKELPPRTDAVLPVQLTTEERRLYDAVHAATRDEVVRQLRGDGNVLAALEALLRLRQAACHPGLLPGRSAETSSKVELLVDELCDVAASGHKALVFSQWTSFLDLVEPRLRAAELTFSRLDGSTRDRGAVVSNFQGPDGPPVLLISLKAGGTGLNLTAADHVFLLDPWWNPAVEDQAADRAHRIGQDRPVTVYRLVAEGTVEEGILQLQEQKRRLAEQALDGSAAALSLQRDELLALLEG